MVKRIIALSLIICSFYHVFSQDCCDKLIKQGIEIDSLKKVIKAEKVNSQQYMDNNQMINIAFRDTIKALKSNLSNLEKFKADKLIIDNKIKVKSDSITSLRDQVLEIKQQISMEKQKFDKILQEEREKARNTALLDVVNFYKNNKFDDVISNSTLLSVQRDMHLIGNNAEVKQVLTDLEKYFKAEEMLSVKFDAVKISDTKLQLAKIKQESSLLVRLTEKIRVYGNNYNELKKTLENLVELDKQKIAGDDEAVQKLKFNVVSSELRNYIYDYYDYDNYPYLSDIIVQIIKRKSSNADTDITDLLKKLN